MPGPWERLSQKRSNLWLCPSTADRQEPATITQDSEMPSRETRPAIDQDQADGPREGPINQATKVESKLNGTCFKLAKQKETEVNRWVSKTNEIYMEF